MNIQLNTKKLKKLSSKNKKIYIVYDNIQMIHGIVEEIGHLYVHVKTENQPDTIPIEIEKIIDISARKNEFYEAQMLERLAAEQNTIMHA